MGIRFKCPNGHKINVKAFLAGKRALCPDCGAKVLVPFESEGAPTLVAAIDAQRATANSEQESPREDALAAAAAAPAAAPVKQFTAAPVAAHALPAKRPAAPATPSPAPVLPPATPPGVVTVDPIAESPLAVWYVRPRTGGQYGPAPGEVFRQWLAEKRVAADSLVWRDGWADWRLASEVLPQLSAARPPGLAAAAPTVSSALVPAMAGAAQAAPGAGGTAVEPAAASATARYVRSRKSKTSTIVAISVLSIVAVVLIGVLVYVLTR